MKLMLLALCIPIFYLFIPMAVAEVEDVLEEKKSWKERHKRGYHIDFNSDGNSVGLSLPSSNFLMSDDTNEISYPNHKKEYLPLYHMIKSPPFSRSDILKTSRTRNHLHSGRELLITNDDNDDDDAITDYKSKKEKIKYTEPEQRYPVEESGDDDSYMTHYSRYKDDAIPRDLIENMFTKQFQVYPYRSDEDDSNNDYSPLKSFIDHYQNKVENNDESDETDVDQTATPKGNIPSPDENSERKSENTHSDEDEIGTLLDRFDQQTKKIANLYKYLGPEEQQRVNNNALQSGSTDQEVRPNKYPSPQKGLLESGQQNDVLGSDRLVYPQGQNIQINPPNDVPSAEHSPYSQRSFPENIPQSDVLENVKYSNGQQGLPKQSNSPIENIGSNTMINLQRFYSPNTQNDVPPSDQSVFPQNGSPQNIPDNKEMVPSKPVYQPQTKNSIGDKFSQALASPSLIYNEVQSERSNLPVDTDQKKNNFPAATLNLGDNSQSEMAINREKGIIDALKGGLNPGEDIRTNMVINQDQRSLTSPAEGRNFLGNTQSNMETITVQDRNSFPPGVNFVDSSHNNMAISPVQDNSNFLPRSLNFGDNSLSNMAIKPEGGKDISLTNRGTFADIGRSGMPTNQDLQKVNDPRNRLTLGNSNRDRVEINPGQDKISYNTAATRNFVGSNLLVPVSRPKGIVRDALKRDEIMKDFFKFLTYKSQVPPYLYQRSTNKYQQISDNAEQKPNQLFPLNYENINQNSNKFQRNYKNDNIDSYVPSPISEKTYRNSDEILSQLFPHLVDQMRDTAFLSPRTPSEIEPAINLPEHSSHMLPLSTTQQSEYQNTPSIKQMFSQQKLNPTPSLISSRKQLPSLHHLVSTSHVDNIDTKSIQALADSLVPNIRNQRGIVMLLVTTAPTNKDGDVPEIKENVQHKQLVSNGLKRANINITNIQSNETSTNITEVDYDDDFSKNLKDATNFVLGDAVKAGNITIEQRDDIESKLEKMLDKQYSNSTGAAKTAARTEILKFYHISCVDKRDDCLQFKHGGVCPFMRFISKGSCQRTCGYCHHFVEENKDKKGKSSKSNTIEKTTPKKFKDLTGERKSITPRIEKPLLLKLTEVPSNPVMYLSFDATTTDNIILDSSGNNNEARFQKNAGVSSRNLGTCGKAAELNEGGIIWSGQTFKHKPKYAITICMWVKVRKSGIINWFANGKKGQKMFYTKSKGSVVPAKVWTHVAGTFDTKNGLARIYINGDLEQEAQQSSGGKLPQNWLINGIGSEFGDDSMHYLDELLIYDHVLNISEIRSLAHRCTFNRMILHYGFQNGNMTNVNDQSGLENDAILIGGAALKRNCNRCGPCLDLQAGPEPAMKIRQISERNLPRVKVSIAVWVSINDTEGNHDIFKTENSQGNIGYHLQVNNGKIRWSIASDRGHVICDNTTEKLVVPESLWTHIIVSYNNENGKVSIFANGNLKLQHKIAESKRKYLPINWDSDAAIGDKSLNGYLDEFIMYNWELDNSEALYVINYCADHPKLVRFTVRVPLTKKTNVPKTPKENKNRRTKYSHTGKKKFAVPKIQINDKKNAEDDTLW